MEQIRFIVLQHLCNSSFCVTYSSISMKPDFLLLAFQDETLVHIAIEQACGHPPLFAYGNHFCTFHW